MNIAELALDELATQDLNGVKVTKLSIEDDSTNAAFDINGMEIQFTINNDESVHATALVLDGTTHTDPVTLAKCADWVDYVAKIVKKAIADQKEKIVPIPELKIEVAPVVETTPTPVIATLPSVENEVVPAIIPVTTEPSILVEATPSSSDPIVTGVPEIVPAAEIGADKTEEAGVTETPELNKDLSPQELLIAEAFERGQKEGYMESRKINLEEIKKVRRKATIIIIVLLVVAALAFGFLWIYFGEELGFNVPEFLQLF